MAHSQLLDTSKICYKTAYKWFGGLKPLPIFVTLHHLNIKVMLVMPVTIFNMNLTRYLQLHQKKIFPEAGEKDEKPRKREWQIPHRNMTVLSPSNSTFISFLLELRHMFMGLCPGINLWDGCTVFFPPKFLCKFIMQIEVHQAWDICLTDTWGTYSVRPIVGWEDLFFFF